MRAQSAARSPRAASSARTSEGTMSGCTAPEAERTSMARRIIGEYPTSVKPAPCFLAHDCMLGEVGPRRAQPRQPCQPRDATGGCKRRLDLRDQCVECLEGEDT